MCYLLVSILRPSPLLLAEGQDAGEFCLPRSETDPFSCSHEGHTPRFLCDLMTCHFLPIDVRL